MINVASFVAGSVMYNLFDNGIANALGLETLRHGTNPLNNLRMRITGGDPKHGGKSSGSTKGWVNDNTETYFYLFKDSEYQYLVNGATAFQDFFIALLGRTKIIALKFFPRIHATLSGYNFVAQIHTNMYCPRVVKCCSIFSSCLAGAFSGLISPTLRFRFSVIDPERMQNDPCYDGAAYRTTRAVEPWRLGLLGSLLTGINPAWFSRVKAKPLKILTGYVQIACAVSLIIISRSVLIANPFLAIPAAAGALLE